ncbi:MAG: methyltransferase [Acidimicrobiia bacterium]|nr:methyltransferase [Acidimicrobiia bacterium]
MPAERTAPVEASPHFKKFVTLRVGGTLLELAVAHDLFSSHAVDAGSKLLLRTLVTIDPPASILDVGCGYGPIGLALKATFPDARLEMIDRDALAVSFASANASRNEIEDTTAYGSLGYDSVGPHHRFDLIVANLPGKAGSAVIEELLLGAGRVLRPGGKAAVVAVAALNDLVADVLENSRAEVLLREEARDYTVFHFRAEPGAGDAASSFERGVYTRAQTGFSFASLDWEASTAWGLPEFDSLSYRTRLMVKLIANAHQKRARALVLEPGQGHVAMALHRCCSPDKITLAGRDLLALEASRANLELNEVGAGTVDVHHAPDLSPLIGPFDLVAAALADKLPINLTTAIVGDLVETVTKRGSLVLGGRSTTITRVVESGILTGLAVKERVRKHGFSAVRVRRG